MLDLSSDMLRMAINYRNRHNPLIIGQTFFFFSFFGISSLVNRIITTAVDFTKQDLQAVKSVAIERGDVIFPIK